MDQIMQQRIQASSKARFLKKTIQFLLSVSFFPLLLSYSSLFLVLYSFNFYFSTFSMKLHNYGIDRHHIFLFCNGLLVFIVKSSGLINNFQSWGMDRHDVDIKSRESQGPVPQISKMKALATAEKTAVEVEEQEGRRENGEMGTEEEVTLDVDEQKESPNGREEQEEEAEEETGLLSAEELNRKCEDFIQKMKERIKHEAKQPVVLSLVT